MSPEYVLQNSILILAGWLKRFGNTHQGALATQIEHEAKSRMRQIRGI